MVHAKQYFVRVQELDVPSSGQKHVKLLASGADGMHFYTDDGSLISVDDFVSVEKYNELREAFIDYVCSGVPNLAPYCKNRCQECVDGRGWCRESFCKGFNP